MKILSTIFYSLSIGSMFVNLSASESSVIIENVNLISTVDGLVSPNMNVFIDNDTIIQVSQQSVEKYIRKKHGYIYRH